MAAVKKTAAMPPLVVIVGPTASGKSDLAMSIAKQYDGEIICADSRTVYKDLDIGTAKPSKDDQDAIRHHLLDVVNPGEPFSVAQFKKLAQVAIDDISTRGKLPIMVGGTGLYVDAVLFDYSFGQPADPQWRAQLEGMDVGQLLNLCREYNIKIPQNMQNRRHLIRAIELGGLPEANRDYIRKNTIVVGITIDNQTLRNRVLRRTEAMLKAGVLQEVSQAAAKYGWDSEAMTGSVYRILRQYLEGNIPLYTALEKVVQSDMQLAKRQRTWFKRNHFIVWGDNTEELKKRVTGFLGNSV